MSSNAPYSRKEEQLNVISHAIGVLFAFWVMWDLFNQSSSTKAYISTTVYSASIFILFLSSTLQKLGTTARSISKRYCCARCAN